MEATVFVVAVVSFIAVIGWTMTAAMRRAGYAYPPQGEATKALIGENGQLRSRIEQLEERLKVLERIATDRSLRLEDEIEKLR